jgi:hypothetical protein
MKTLKISLISFAFIFAVVNVASAHQNVDKAKKAKAANNAAKPAATKGGDKKKDVGMAVKGQGASNSQSTNTNTKSTTINK